MFKNRANSSFEDLFIKNKSGKKIFKNPRKYYKCNIHYIDTIVYTLERQKKIQYTKN